MRGGLSQGGGGIGRVPLTTEDIDLLSKSVRKIKSYSLSICVFESFFEEDKQRLTEKLILMSIRRYGSRCVRHF